MNDFKLPLNPVLDDELIDEEDDKNPFDKLREECGVMAVYNHPDAARMTYWGLYSLQHRGQESAGIASADGSQVNVGEARCSTGSLQSCSSAPRSS